MDGEGGTTKYAKGAKRQATLQSSTFAYFAHFVVKIDFRQLSNNLMGRVEPGPRDYFFDSGSGGAAGFSG